MKPRIKCTI